MFHEPSINIITKDLQRLQTFYEKLGFRETFRTPREGMPVHVEVTLENFTVGISSVKAAISDHGLNLNLGGNPVSIILWSDDTDGDYKRLTSEGAQSLSPPHTFLNNLRAAYIADPDGNPVNIVQKLGS